jgi:hypothetical protein
MLQRVRGSFTSSSLHMEVLPVPEGPLMTINLPSGIENLQLFSGKH